MDFELWNSEISKFRNVKTMSLEGATIRNEKLIEFWTSNCGSLRVRNFELWKKYWINSWSSSWIDSRIISWMPLPSGQVTSPKKGFTSPLLWGADKPPFLFATLSPCLWASSLPIGLGGMRVAYAICRRTFLGHLTPSKPPQATR